MRCIGDECAKPLVAATSAHARVPLLRSIAVGVLCAGLGYFAAHSRPVNDSGRHLVAIAPPLVMVSEIGE